MEHPRSLLHNSSVVEWNHADKHRNQSPCGQSRKVGPRCRCHGWRGTRTACTGRYFFSCPNGRLKLRVLSDGCGVLIYYRREDELGPKPSFYVHSETSDPDGLRSVLAVAYGEVGRVRKHRMVFGVGQTRVHLDRVDGLGEFLELEVTLQDALTSDAAVAEAHRLIAAFGIDESALVKGAYLDLLNAENVIYPH